MMIEKKLYIFVLVFLLLQNSYAGDWFSKSLQCNDEVAKKNRANVTPCLEAIRGIKEENHNTKLKEKNSILKLQNQALVQMYLNAGAIYYYKNDKTNAYKYFMIAAKMDQIEPIAAKSAKENIIKLCKESPWICN